MNKTEFAKALAERTDMTVTQAVHVTDEFLDLLKQGVSKGERIAFLGFGTFSVTRRAASTGVNPRNPSQKVKIPARNVVPKLAGLVSAVFSRTLVRSARTASKLLTSAPPRMPPSQVLSLSPLM